VPYAELLTEEEIGSGLVGLPSWSRDGKVIQRTVRCATFPAAIELVRRVADAAEAADHHPQILIDWRRVTFTLSTHASGGLTAKDLAMAAQIDALAEPIYEDVAAGASPRIGRE
jgi:4a-hydroxytetrahydrobiopterin dehydratase